MSCSISLPKLIGLLALDVIMVAASWLATRLPAIEAKIAGWIGLVFFGAMGLVIVRRSFMWGPIVVLDGTGILDRRVSPDVVLWSDIRSMRLVTYEKQRFIGVELMDPITFRSRLPASSQWLTRLSEHMGFNSFNLGFNDLSPGVDAVWSYLRQHHPDKVRSEGS